MRNLALLSLIGTCLFATACPTSLGRFTVASTKNVQGLNYDSSTAVKTRGESCLRGVFGFTFGDRDDRIQRAMDDAIEKGQKSGAKGDLLTNVRIDVEAFQAFFYSQNCIFVEGELVELNSGGGAAAPAPAPTPAPERRSRQEAEPEPEPEAEAAEDGEEASDDG